MEKPPKPDSPDPKPPKGLSYEARKLWKTLVSGWHLDESAYFLLRQCCELLDRLRQAQAILADEGLTVLNEKTGMVAAHPMVKTEKDTRKAAWEAHRETIMADYMEGYRPQAFWQYDRFDVDLSQYESQLAALVDLGLATPKEIAVFHGLDMFDAEKEEAEYFIKNEGARNAFPKYTWEPIVEKYKKIFGDK